ncbi:hypothetical protein ACHAXT_001606 [Thalassiosira profunda]
MSDDDDGGYGRLREGYYDEYDEGLADFRAAYGGEEGYGEYGDEADGAEEDELSESDELERFLLNIGEGKLDDEAGVRLGGSRAAPVPANPADYPAELRVDAVDRLDLRLGRISGRAVDVGVLSSIDLAPDYGADYGEPDLILPHDESLDASWDAVVNSPFFGATSSLSIEKIELTDTILRKIAGGLKGKSLHYLTLSRTSLSDKGLLILADLVGSSRHLEAFSLMANPINDLPAAGTLSRALLSAPRLQKVDLTRCNLGDNPDILSVILQSNAKGIGLQQNGIGSAGAEVIAQYIERNPRTWNIDLYGNALGDNDAILIAEALKKNNKLYGMQLEGNRFTVAGAKSLMSAIFDASSLNSIAESNHTCNLRLFSIGPQTLLSRINFEFDRKKKVLVALQSKSDALLRYLMDVPVELMPRVLEFVQAESNARKRANTMYAIARFWEMPSLYSYHRLGAKPSSKRKREE